MLGQHLTSFNIFGFCSYCFLMFNRFRSNRQMIFMDTRAELHRSITFRVRCKEKIDNLHSCTKTQHHTIRMSTVIYVILMNALFTRKLLYDIVYAYTTTICTHHIPTHTYICTLCVIYPQMHIHARLHAYFHA